LSDAAAATRALARFVAESRWADVPQPIRHEAKRAILNWLGCALGGCRDETVERLLLAVSPFSGPREATLIGRDEKLDALNAALVNAVSSNILDYDDTHMKTVMHPSVPVAAALFALAEHRPVTGARLVHAFVLGVETGCRAGNAVTPEHYAAGWHISATCGVLGVAAGAAKLLDLDERRTAWALGIAATQASGLTEMLGSMTKSYNMGHAAKSGLLAALLAERGFTSSERALEAPRGFANVLCRTPKLDEIARDLGETWELQWNAYKPFPCGIVLHAAIDGCIQLRSEYSLTSDRIARVEVRMHPLGLQLAGKPEPVTGLEGKLSVYHAAAVALLYGRAGVSEFTDACVQDRAVVALRQRVRAIPDESLDKAAAVVAIELEDGRRITREVPHAIGSLERPMSDADIETKVRELAADSYSECHAWDLIELAWSLDRLNDAGAVVRATAKSKTD
jgi:2-methylcitrate dehydratase PrpD